MRSAGFTEVESRLLTLPMCAWSSGRALPVPNQQAQQGALLTSCKDQRERAIGQANRENVFQMLYSLALHPFTQLKGQASRLVGGSEERRVG